MIPRVGWPAVKRVISAAATVLWTASAAGSEPAVRTLKAASANIAVAVPRGWSGSGDGAQITVKGSDCRNWIWFDYIAAVSVEYTKRLIDSGSLPFSAAIRYWHARQYSDTRVAAHPAVLLRSSERGLARHTFYLVPVQRGVLIAHMMAVGDDATQCVEHHQEAADKLANSFFRPAVLKRAGKLSATSSPPPVNNIEPVPGNLDEAFEALEKMLSKEALETFRSGSKADVVRYHLSLGMALRNRWGLWQGSPLAKYFNEKGVFHPDDMSGIILGSFWRHLNPNADTVEATSRSYLEYGDLRNRPEPRRCEDGTQAVALAQLYEADRNAAPRFVHVFVCGAGGALWAYERETGWYEPDAALRKRVEDVRTRNVVAAPLEVKGPP